MLPELNYCNTTAEEEFKITGKIVVFAEECLDAILENEELSEELDTHKINMKRAADWIKEWFALDDSVKLNSKAIDLLTTALNTLED